MFDLLGWSSGPAKLVGWPLQLKSGTAADFTCKLCLKNKTKRQIHLTLVYLLVQYHFALHPPFNIVVYNIPSFYPRIRQHHKITTRPIYPSVTYLLFANSFCFIALVMSVKVSQYSIIEYTVSYPSHLLCLRLSAILKVCLQTRYLRHMLNTKYF